MFKFNKNFNYKITDDGIVITKIKNNKNKDIEIPEYIDGVEVTGIDLTNKIPMNIERLKIPSTIKKVNENSFKNWNIDSLIMCSQAKGCFTNTKIQTVFFNEPGMIFAHNESPFFGCDINTVFFDENAHSMTCHGSIFDGCTIDRIYFCNEGIGGRYPFVANCCINSIFISYENKNFIGFSTEVNEDDYEHPTNKIDSMIIDCASATCIDANVDFIIVNANIANSTFYSKSISLEKKVSDFRYNDIYTTLLCVNCEDANIFDLSGKVDVIKIGSTTRVINDFSFQDLVSKVQFEEGCKSIGRGAFGMVIGDLKLPDTIEKIDNPFYKLPSYIENVPNNYKIVEYCDNIFLITKDEKELVALLSYSNNDVILPSTIETIRPFAISGQVTYDLLYGKNVKLIEDIGPFVEIGTLYVPNLLHIESNTLGIGNIIIDKKVKFLEDDLHKDLNIYCNSKDISYYKDLEEHNKIKCVLDNKNALFNHLNDYHFLEEKIQDKYATNIKKLNSIYKDSDEMVKVALENEEER